MELRVLQYFLAVAREQSISGAAEYLHLSQPTLSRQLKDLEEELGKQLFIRGNRQITLTVDGMLLRKRAEEIVELVRKTENEIMTADKEITGDLVIGSGETDAIRLISRVARKIQADYPKIHFHIVSGDSIDVLEHLEKGLYDFGILLGSIDLSKYESISLPTKDTWGVLMRKDSPLADQEYIHPSDLWDQPLIISRQAHKNSSLSTWLQKDYHDLNITATYNLVYNASLMVDEGLGYALCLDKLINTTGDTNLRFRPLEYADPMEIHIVWKKYQYFSKPAEKFLEELKKMLLLKTT